MQIRALRAKYSQVFFAPLGDRGVAAYAARRRQLLARLDAPLLIAGMPGDPGGEEVWWMHPVRPMQDPAFLHLTGVNQAGCVLWLDPSAKSAAEREILFVPDRNPGREFWDGVRLGLPSEGNSAEMLLELQQLTGLHGIRSASGFENFLHTRLKHSGAGKVNVYYHRYVRSDGKSAFKVDQDHNAVFQRRIKSILNRINPSLGIECGALPVVQQRCILDDAAIEETKEAIRITRKSFLEFLPRLHALANETEAAAELEYGMLRNNPWGLSFPTIAACGDGACTLHYQKKDEPLRKGRLLLLDFGVRWGSGHADISRTVPVGGRFTPLQRLLYQIVVDTNLFHASQVRPGATIADLNRRAWQYLEHLVQERFLALGGTMERSYGIHPETGVASPHGISHLIGTQVHEGDPFRLYRHQPLKPGMLISNEPGLYGSFRLKVGGRLYTERLGIRIEDDLLVTKDGCVNLSQGIPRNPEDIERLFQS